MTRRKTQSKTKARKDVNEEILNNILKVFDEGRAPWIKPWNDQGGTGVPRKAVSGGAYRGINVLLLIIAEHMGGFGCSRWITYRQVQDEAEREISRFLGRSIMSLAPKVGKKSEIGYSRWNKARLDRHYWMLDQVREKGGDVNDFPHILKGSKSVKVVFYTTLERKKTDADGNILYDAEGKPKIDRIPVPKQYPVFNIDQVANCPDRLKGDNLVINDPKFDLDEDLEHRLREAFPDLTYRIQGTRAFYRGGDVDLLVMPDVERFETKRDWYATTLHEHAHATGHPKRLNRESLIKRGPDQYAREEIVAEMASAFLCTALGLPTCLQHPDYIAGYAQHFRDSAKNEIVRCCSQAQKVMDYVLEQMGLSIDVDDHPDAELDETAEG